jgi:ABC-type phosphate transport system substrate-binding protein
VKKMWKWAGVLGAAALTLPALAASPAGAAPAGYGFDNSPHVIVGAGSDTTYRAQIALADLYNYTPGCTTTTAVGPTLGQCIPGSDTNALGNHEHDTVAQANPNGSGAGIASLNGFLNGQSNVTYPGTVNENPAYLGSSAVGPNADFARSSRGPKTSGGSVIGGGSELGVDTFWGYAQDGVEVTVFDARGAQLQSAGFNGFTPAQIAQIYSQTTIGNLTWHDLFPSAIAAGSATDGPIVPWGMNSSSGTYSTFNSYVTANAPQVGFDVNVHGRKLANNTFPFENDIKPLLNNAPLSTSRTSVDNPANWVWFGSFGVFSAFPYTSSAVVGGTQHTAFAAAVNGVLPSTSKIGLNTYPIGRTLYHVTRDEDATISAGFGPTIGATHDLNVTGAVGGVGGAVREYTRWLCRPGTAQHAVDTFTGASLFSEITSAINSAGFTTVPAALRYASDGGSRCQIIP